ncbi:MAG: hypothetical protein WCI18_15450 [Pseudomonadota bacterium]
MTLFSNLKLLPPQMGRILGLGGNRIHPLKQADLLFSEIQRKKQFILDMAQNFESKTPGPSDCIFWIRATTKQVLENEMLLRKNKKNIALIRALGDLLPRKVETADEFCQLICQEWNLLAQKQADCKLALESLKKGFYKTQQSQVKKSVTLENMMSMDGLGESNPSDTSLMVPSMRLHSRGPFPKDPLELLTFHLSDRRVVPENEPFQEKNRLPESLPVDYLEMPPANTRTQTLVKSDVAPPPTAEKNDVEIPPKPHDDVLNNFAHFLNSVLQAN